MKYAIITFGILSTLLLTQCAEQAIFDNEASVDEDLQEIVYDELEIDQLSQATETETETESGSESISGAETAEDPSSADPSTSTGIIFGEAGVVDPEIGPSLLTPDSSISPTTGPSSGITFAEPPEEEMLAETYDNDNTPYSFESQGNQHTYININAFINNLQDHDLTIYDLDNAERSRINPEDNRPYNDSDLNPTPIPYEQFERPSP